ncbi:unnamed protein product [Linum trigynum]|uniref:Uncharacterized protein n=1 Tax=Linum trigynum TaxID=586398 RepID=A0AAV2ERL7_9ROSI
MGSRELLYALSFPEAPIRRKAFPRRCVEIIRSHPRNISASATRPPNPNYGTLHEEQGNTSMVPMPLSSMLFVEDNGGESSNWVIQTSKGKFKLGPL